MTEFSRDDLMVVVFKKGVTEEQAAGLLERFGYPFREGSDGSRGKIYFYKNGPQFLVEVPKDAHQRFGKALKKFSQVNESRTVDWSIQKD